MKPPLFVRSFEAGEQHQLEDALTSQDAFRLRRAQYLLASARGLKPLQIANDYGGSEQNVRNIVHAFNATGLDCLTQKSSRPVTVQPLLGEEELARLQHLLHQSPRTFDKKRSTWTQELLAEVSQEEGLTETKVSDETIRRALKRLKANWKRAKHWITSPDPAYARKKSRVSV